MVLLLLLLQSTGEGLGDNGNRAVSWEDVYFRVCR